MDYSPGSNIANLHWIWQSMATSIDQALCMSQPVIEEVKKSIPQFHTTAMRRAMYEKFGLISSSIKSVLRHLYREFTDDVNERVSTFLELEELTLMYDLRDSYSGKFETFWDKANEYLQETVGTAVDDRKHSEVVHLATAILVRNLRE